MGRFEAARIFVRGTFSPLLRPLDRRSAAATRPARPARRDASIGTPHGGRVFGPKFAPLPFPALDRLFRRRASRGH